jgi:hypothetical protein
MLETAENRFGVSLIPTPVVWTFAQGDFKESDAAVLPPVRPYPTFDKG